MDDYSPVPMAPALDAAEIPYDPVDIKEEKEIANAYYDPNWHKVFEMFEEQLEILSSDTDPNLIADEYKIEDMAKKKAKGIINQILGRINDAVTAVESAERDTKGGK